VLITSFPTSDSIIYYERKKGKFQGKIISSGKIMKFLKDKRPYCFMKTDEKEKPGHDMPCHVAVPLAMTDLEWA